MRRQKVLDMVGFSRFEQFLEEWSRRDFMKRTGGAAALAALMAGVPEFLAACGPQQAQPGPAVSPVKGGHLIEGTFSDPKTFNSVLVSDNVSDLISGLCFDGLLTFNPKGERVGLLSQNVPKPSDGLTYTFNLRKDVKWSDGRPFTADDVIFTYELMYHPKYREVNSPRRGNLEEFVESLTAPDPFTVMIKTKKVFAPFLTNQTGYGILPKHVLGNLAPKDINTAEFNSNPTVVNGNFKFVKWDKGQQVVLARNDTYYRGAPLLDQFVLKIVPSQVILSQQLKTGEIDVGSIDNSQLADVQASPNVNVTKYTTFNFEYYAYNLDPAKTGGKIFGEKAVRQALLYALNRQQMANAVYFKEAQVADTIEPPLSWAYNPNVKQKYSHDKPKAEQMLDDAGWKKGADGIREKGGVKMKFELITNSGNKVRENLITVMQQQWKEIGVDATPKPVDFNGVLVPQIQNTRTFDIYLVGFGPFTDPDQSNLWHSRNTKPGGFNGSLYKNPEVDRLLDDGVATIDQEKRKEIYFKLQEILADDVPAPILVFAKALVGVNKRVQGTQFGPWPSRRFWMKDVFVTDGK